MKKRYYVLIIIFIFFILFASKRIYHPFVSFEVLEKVGTSKYYKVVVTKIKIYDWNKRVDKISYCFENAKYCRLLEVKDESYYQYQVSFPTSSKRERLCVYLNDKKICQNKSFLVDGDNISVKSSSDLAVIDEGSKLNINRYFNIEDNVSGVARRSCRQEKHSNYIKLDCLFVSNNGSVDEANKYISIRDKNVLSHKKIAFLGDSITNAGPDRKRFNGWAGRVALANQMTFQNLGVNGATFTKIEGRGHILAQLDDVSKDIDYIIIQGGINDASIGRASAFEGPKEESMLYWLEETFRQAKERFPKAKIGFIITYKTPKASWGIKVTDRSEDAKIMRRLCDKYRIEYLDLYDGSIIDGDKHKTFDELLDTSGGSSFHEAKAEDVHLSDVGYDLLSPYISDWIKTL